MIPKRSTKPPARVSEESMATVARGVRSDMLQLRLTQHAVGEDRHRVEISLEGDGARRTAESTFRLPPLRRRIEEDLRWYLEDFLQYPQEPAPTIARRIEGRMAEVGTELFRVGLPGERRRPRSLEPSAGAAAGDAHRDHHRRGGSHHDPLGAAAGAEDGRRLSLSRSIRSCARSPTRPLAPQLPDRRRRGRSASSW